jgi:mannosylglucosylglycerate synthase
VLEAGLARLPVIASDIPPFHESAGEWAELFDPTGDPEVAGRALLDRLESSRAYQLRRRVLDRFTWQAIVHKQIIPMLSKWSK